MKQLRMIFNFYRRSGFAVGLIFVLMTLSLFLVSNAVGNYRFAVYTRDLYRNAGLENAVYYMPLSQSDIKFGSDGIQAKVKESKTEILKFPAAENCLIPNFGILSYEGKPGNFLLYDKALNKAFPLPVAEGEWFSKQSFNQTGSGGPYDVVVGGTLFSNAVVGSNLPITFYKDGKETVVIVHVKGKLSYPAYIPEFGSSGNIISADGFLNNWDVVIFQKTTDIENMLNKKSVLNNQINYFVQFSPSASKQEINRCLDYMQANGMFADYDDIMKNTEEHVADELRSQLPIPLFFLFVSTISLLCVSVLLVYKKLREYAVYYLCGCSRKRSFLTIALAIGLIGLLAGAINVAFVANYPLFASRGILNLGSVIIDRSSLWYLIGYVLAVAGLSILLPFYVFHRESPIELYRRKEE